MIEIKLTFEDDELSKIHNIVSGDKFHSVCKDLSGWLNKELREQQYYDKETLEYVDDKLNEILLNYGVGI